MSSPILAMLWENWRLSRFELIQRLAFTSVAGSALLVIAGNGSEPGSSDFGPAHVLFLGVIFHGMLWMSIAKLTGGTMLDGYRPGFPLHLLYARPVRTALLVAVPMAYAAISAAGLYVAWALLVRLAFGYPFPLVPLAAWVATLHVVQAAAYWSTRSRLVQWVGSMGAFLGCLVLAFRPTLASQFFAGRTTSLLPEDWSTLFDYSLTDYALVAAIILISFTVTVAGVTRQRRGDARAFKPRTTGSTRSPDWLVNLFRLPCPTSSRMRAQVWFDLKASGLFVLAIGLVFALALPLLYALGGAVPEVRPYAFAASAFAVLIPLLLGGNAFGVRRKQGRTYPSVFDATRAYATGWVAALKVLVRTVCVLSALTMVGVSLWVSVRLTHGWPDAGQEVALLQTGRSSAEALFAALTGYQKASFALILFIATAVTVATRAAFEALWARYRRGLVVGLTVTLLLGLTFVLRALLGREEGRVEIVVDALLAAIPSVAAAAIVLGTGFLVWRVYVERLLTAPLAYGAIAVSAAFGAAWFTVVRAAGVQIAALAPVEIAWLLLPMLLPLTAWVLAPWSLSRVRHE